MVSHLCINNSNQFKWLKESNARLYSGKVIARVKQYLRHVSPSFVQKHHSPAKATQDDQFGRYYSSTAPMTTISGVLESSWAALSSGRIISVIWWLFENRLGQKRGEKATGSSTAAEWLRYINFWAKYNVGINRKLSLSCIDKWYYWQSKNPHSSACRPAPIHL